MTVAEYLRRERMTAGQLAHKLGVSRGNVYAWAKGAMPRGVNLQRLLRGTQGAITVADLVRASEERLDP